MPLVIGMSHSGQWYAASMRVMVAVTGDTQPTHPSEMTREELIMSGIFAAIVGSLPKSLPFILDSTVGVNLRACTNETLVDLVGEGG